MENISRLLNVIIEIDIKLFKFINITLHNEFLAELMKFTANDIFLAALVFAGMFFLLKTGSRKEKINIAFGLWAIIITNIINSHILKNIFKRPRPVMEIQDMYFLVKMKSINYAFPSTHTAMATVLAVILWSDYRKIRPLLALFLFCVGFFCVYTGGHYPLDVAGGFVVGLIFGIIINILKRHVKEKHEVKQT